MGAARDISVESSCQLAHCRITVSYQVLQLLKSPLFQPSAILSLSLT